MGLRQIFIFGDEVGDIVPEIFRQMAFYSVTNTLRFTNINGTFIGIRIDSSKEIYPGAT